MFETRTGNARPPPKWQRWTNAASEVERRRASFFAYCGLQRPSFADFLQVNMPRDAALAEAFARLPAWPPR